MNIERLRVGPFVTNCYIIVSGKDAMIIDPGYNAEKIDNALNGAVVSYVVLTHGHFDHVYESDFFRKKYGAKVVILDKEAATLADPSSVMPFSQQIDGYEERTYSADVIVHDGDVFTFNEYSFEIIHTPGHTPGSMCLYCEKEKILISGDTLFNGSVGRTDFRNGSETAIMESVEKLMKLPDDTKVYPGHGFQTTIENERKFNPYCRG